MTPLPPLRPPRAVLVFPVRTAVVADAPLTLSRCAGRCGALVTSAGAWCLSCAVEETDA
jgi:hypothetical protein